MKKNVFLAAMTMLGVTCSAPIAEAALIAPTLTDNVWYASCFNGATSYLAGFNTAMINRSVNGFFTTTLMGSAYYGNNTSGGVEFMDLRSGYTVSIPMCGSSIDFRTEPDIIIGNDPVNPATDYNAAVAHDGTIDFYHIAYSGGFTFSVSYVSTATLPSYSGEGPTHIDIIAQAGNTRLPGCPSAIIL